MDSLGDQCVVKFGHLHLSPTTKGMEGIQEPTSRLNRIVLRFKQILKPSGNDNEKRIRRRNAMVQLLTSRLTLIKLVSFFPACEYNIQ